MFLPKSLFATLLAIASSAPLALAQGGACGIDYILINADTDESVGLLVDQLVDGFLCIPDYEVNIEARPTASCPRTRSALMKLRGPTSVTNTENVAPFALFRNSGSNFFGRSLEEGKYTLSSVIYSEGSLEGTRVVRSKLIFSTKECPPPPVSLKLT